MRVLHLVAQRSRPNGYTRRTDELVAAQADQTAISVVSAEGQSTLIDHARVRRQLDDWAEGDTTPIRPEIRRAAALYAAARLEPPPDMIHAHSPWWCALAASALASDWGVPWVYEMRGLQHWSAIEDRVRAERSPWFTWWTALEDAACAHAGHVFPICPGLEAHAKAAGARGTTLAPNGVDPTAWHPLAENDRKAVAASIGVEQPYVLYFGSLRPLEGVDALLAGLARSSRPVVIVGDGDSREDLERFAGRLRMSDRVLFAGHLPVVATRPIVAAAGCVAITRRETPVTEVVSPLKPLEALACATPVVSRGLPALRYVGERGTLFFDIDEQLSDAVERALADEALGPDGREWVSSARTWQHTVRAYDQGYAACVRASD